MFPGGGPAADFYRAEADRPGGRVLGGSQQVRSGDCLALGAVDGACVAQLEVAVDVLGREASVPGTAGHAETVVAVDAGHGPRLAVGDIELAVIAPCGDAVADSDALPRPGRDRLFVG